VRARSILALFLAALPASCFLWKQKPGPNVLLISVDSLRFDAISHSLGAARTPNIQRLAADGVAYSYCFSHSPSTLPSTAALFSGRMPSDTRIMNNAQRIGDDLPLLPDWLAKQGFRTSASVSIASLWPPAPSEDESAERADGAQHADVMPASSRKSRTEHGIERGFQIYHMSKHELASAAEVNSALLPLAATTPEARPWFIFAQYSEPHEPHDAHGSSAAVARMTLGGKPFDTVKIADTQWWKKEITLEPGTQRLKIASDVPFKIRRFECHGPAGDLPLRFEGAAPMDTTKSALVVLENTGTSPMRCTLEGWFHDVPTVEEARRRYKLEVESVDKAIGALLDELHATNQYDETCIVLTADHGEALGEHGRVGHSSGLFDELLRVPLIIKPPKSSDARDQLRKLELDIVRQIDIAPTILELIDCPPLPGAQGVSLLRPDERVLTAETHPPEAASSMFAMRDARYKVVFVAGEDRFEMFDLNSDTLEVDDVFPLQGHYRSSWQTQLHKLAQSAPQLANVRMGVAPKAAAAMKSIGY
jgi:arylsulfatase A-like enzyme